MNRAILNKAWESAHSVLHRKGNSKKDKIEQGKALTQRISHSFNDLDWACGHTGPAVCQKCWDALVQERNQLREKLNASR